MGEIPNKNSVVGFTGTKQGMRDEQVMSLTRLLIDLDGERFHHGDCRGADVQAAALAHSLGYRIICHPPINPRHRGWFSKNDEIHIPYDYVVRDHHIVNVSEILIATPHIGYEIIQSGTWTTVRYAREKGRLIYIIQPDGTIQKEENVQKYTTGVIS